MSDEAAERALVEARATPAVSYGHLHQEVVAAYEYGRNPMERVEFIVKYMCALFGVQAESADPVDVKARELWDVSNRTWTPWDAVEGDLREQFLALARHVLAQEGQP